jgi:hypothetical protein
MSRAIGPCVPRRGAVAAAHLVAGGEGLGGVPREEVHGADLALGGQVRERMRLGSDVRVLGEGCAAGGVPIDQRSASVAAAGAARRPRPRRRCRERLRPYLPTGTAQAAGPRAPSWMPFRWPRVLEPRVARGGSGLGQLFDPTEQAVARADVRHVSARARCGERASTPLARAAPPGGRRQARGRLVCGNRKTPLAPRGHSHNISGERWRRGRRLQSGGAPCWTERGAAAAALLQPRPHRRAGAGRRSGPEAGRREGEADRAHPAPRSQAVGGRACSELAPVTLQGARRRQVLRRPAPCLGLVLPACHKPCHPAVSSLPGTAAQAGARSAHRRSRRPARPAGRARRRPASPPAGRTSRTPRCRRRCAAPRTAGCCPTCTRSRRRFRHDSGQAGSWRIEAVSSWKPSAPLPGVAPTVALTDERTASKKRDMPGLSGDACWPLRSGCTSCTWAPAARRALARGGREACSCAVHLVSSCSASELYKRGPEPRGWRERPPGADRCGCWHYWHTPPAPLF